MPAQIIEDVTVPGPADWAYLLMEDGHLVPVHSFSAAPEPGATGFAFSTELGDTTRVHADAADGWRGVRAQTLQAAEAACEDSDSPWLPDGRFWASLDGPWSGWDESAVPNAAEVLGRIAAGNRLADALPALHSIDRGAWLVALKRIHADLVRQATS